jgi:TRAP-type C4-dicarboxylate transport system permease small subunit
MQHLKGILRAVDRLSHLAGVLVTVLVPAMVATITIDVVSRYFFNEPTIWAYDTVIFMFGYLGLLAGAFVSRRRAHINVDVLYERCSQRGQAALNVAGGLVVFFFLALVIVYGLTEAINAIEMGARRSSQWAPPVGHFLLVIPMSAGLIALQEFANWLRSLYFLIVGEALD